MMHTLITYLAIGILVILGLLLVLFLLYSNAYLDNMRFDLGARREQKHKRRRKRKKRCAARRTRRG